MSEQRTPIDHIADAVATIAAARRCGGGSGNALRAAADRLGPLAPRDLLAVASAIAALTVAGECPATVGDLDS